MSIPYLGAQSWADITREERTYCADVFSAAKDNIPRFIECINKCAGIRKQGIYFEPHDSWEIGFEVCFYRDLLRSVGRSVYGSQFANKRTFDLCLFSPANLVIIEAKVTSRFDRRQGAQLERDPDAIRMAIRTCHPKAAIPRITVLGLTSATYVNNLLRYSEVQPRYLHGFLTWAQLSASYPEQPSFNRAERLYREMLAAQTRK